MIFNLNLKDEEKPADVGVCQYEVKKYAEIKQ